MVPLPTEAATHSRKKEGKGAARPHSEASPSGSVSGPRSGSAFCSGSRNLLQRLGSVSEKKGGGREAGFLNTEVEASAKHWGE